MRRGGGRTTARTSWLDCYMNYTFYWFSVNFALNFLFLFIAFYNWLRTIFMCCYQLKWCHFTFSIELAANWIQWRFFFLHFDRMVNSSFFFSLHPSTSILESFFFFLHLKCNKWKWKRVIFQKNMACVGVFFQTAILGYKQRIFAIWKEDFAFCLSDWRLSNHHSMFLHLKQSMSMDIFIRSS